jgi:hypothetical protein
VEEVTDGHVLRTGVGRRGIAPFQSRAQPDDFVPSSEDKRIAEETGKDVLVSVFDCERTTPIQCLAIRLVPPTAPLFQLSVQGIRSINVPEQPRSLHVVRDPLPMPFGLLPGADGHCGIAGIHRPPGGSRTVQRLILSKLVDLCVSVTV